VQPWKLTAQKEIVMFYEIPFSWHLQNEYICIDEELEAAVISTTSLQ